MTKATTLSLQRFIVAAIITLPFSHGFLIGTQHNTDNPPCGGIKTSSSSSLAETQRDEENAAVDNHRRTLLLLTSLCSCCCRPALSYAADNDDNSVVSTPSLPSDMISIQGIHDSNLQNLSIHSYLIGRVPLSLVHFLYPRHILNSFVLHYLLQLTTITTKR